MKKILLIADNEFLLQGFISISKELCLDEKCHIEIAYSPGNRHPECIRKLGGYPLNLQDSKDIQKAATFDIVFSLHCKQVFPGELIERTRCINIHPGYNPHVRGWYPHVFAILEKGIAGATIHEIDCGLDSGPIIDRLQVPIEDHDTSLDVYKKIQQAELELLRRNLINIVNGTFTARQPEFVGKLKLKRDFDDLCRLDMNNKDTLANHIALLRALSHGDFRNAYFIDREGRKVYVKLVLELEK